MNKESWIRKLTSRKFWLALAGFITGAIKMIQNPSTDAQSITALILSLGSIVAYCVAEGFVDANNTEHDVVYVPVDYAPNDEENHVEEIER